MYKQILKELKEHMPFTAFGAAAGIIMIIFLQKLPSKLSYNIFYTLHPLHVFLSALVTSSMYNFYKCGTDKKKCNLGVLFFIGYVGSVGIATLSDSVIPYLGEILLNMPHREIHLGFIEKWWLVNPLALFGIGIAYHKIPSPWSCPPQYLGFTLPYYYGFRADLKLVYLYWHFYFSVSLCLDTLLCKRYRISSCVYKNTKRLKKALGTLN